MQKRADTTGHKSESTALSKAESNAESQLAASANEAHFQQISRQAPQQNCSEDNGSSNLTEAPIKPVPGGTAQLKRHDFPDGGGSDGAEAFRRRD